MRQIVTLGDGMKQSLGRKCATWGHVENIFKCGLLGYELAFHVKILQCII